MKIIQEGKAWIDGVFTKLDKKFSYTAVKSREKIPYSTIDGVHDDYSMPEKITRWTNGFWGGLMWLMYSQTGKDCYKITAERSQEKMQKAFERVHKLHHDVGFMFHILHGADYRLNGNEKSKNINFLSALILASRYEARGGYIRCWNGTWRDEDTDGWTIIDSMMNLGLLYWASEVSGDERFKRMAITHADTVMANHIRENGSVNHIVVNDPNEFRKMLDSKGGQGYQKGSCWSRGCSWAVYGFILSYIRTGKKEYLDTAIRCADYFIEQVSKTGYLPLSDFMQPESPVYYDSTAGAIASCGFIEIAKVLGEEKGEKYLTSALKILKTLEEKCCDYSLENQSLLQMGTESYGRGVHKPIIYGDYFFTEAILKLKGNEFIPW